MAIYRRGYKSYQGPLTPERSRFLVLTRYAWSGLFQSRLLTAFFVVCFFYPVGALAALYLNNSAASLAQLRIQTALFDVDGRFFFFFLSVQGSLAFLLTTFVGPGLVAPDLANGGLALYFCRPFSRAEYVLGKMGVLFVLLSLITWIPGLILFGIQSSLAGLGWMWSNLWIASAIVISSLLWILIQSLMALALSAWVKWKIAAAALMLAILFMGAGFGQAVNNILRTQQGPLLDITRLIGVVWAKLFRVEYMANRGISQLEAWTVLLAVCAGCLVLLAKKLRAHEVVK